MQALRGISGDSLAISGASGDGGVAVVQGRASTDEGPRALLTWAGDDGQAAKTVPLPVKSPLLNISTWWTGTEVAVFALPCRGWTDELPPALDDGVTLSEACGNDTYSLLTWSPTTEKWRLEQSLDLTARDGATVSSVEGTRAIVTAGFQLSVTEVLVDAADGSVARLPDGISTGGGAENAFQACLIDGRVLGLLEWQTEAPPDLPATDLVRTSPAGSKGPPRNLLAVTVEGDQWRPVPIAGDIAPSGVGTRLLCTNGALFDATGDVPALLSLVGNEVQVRPVREPTPTVEDAVITYVPDVGQQTVVAVAWPMDLSEGDNVDAPKTSQAWVLEDGRWSAAGDVGYGGLWKGLVVKDRIIAFAPRSASSTRDVLEVQPS